MNQGKALAGNRSERWTPIRIIEKVKKFYGGSIQLDPATSPGANEEIQAEKYYYRNGENIPWDEAKIFVNPPFDENSIVAFAIHARRQIRRPGKRTIVWLSNNSTETFALQHLLTISDAVCFPNSRMAFRGPGTTGNKAMQGQVIILLSNLPNKDKLIQRFERMFKNVGPIYTRWIPL